MKLYDVEDVKLSKGTDITSISFPQSLSWNDFADAKEEWNLTYVDKVTAVGGRNYCNWVSGGLFGATKDQDLFTGDDEPQDAERVNQFNNTSLDSEASAAGQVMGPGGKCMVAALEDENISREPNNVPVMGTYLCNIKQYSSPYSIDPKYSIYRSYGNYFKPAKYDSRYINTIPSNWSIADVFDGDCFIEPFEYISEHKFDHPYLKYHRD